MCHLTMLKIITRVRNDKISWRLKKLICMISHRCSLFFNKVTMIHDIEYAEYRLYFPLIELVWFLMYDVSIFTCSFCLLLWWFFYLVYVLSVTSIFLGSSSTLPKQHILRFFCPFDWYVCTFSFVDFLTHNTAKQTQIQKLNMSLIEDQKQ